MAGSIGLAEYIQTDFHQIVTAVLLAIALQIRLLSRHQIGLLYGINLIGIQSLHLHIHHRLLVAWMQVVSKENGTLLVLTYIVNGTVVAFVWRNQAILVAIKNHRLHAIVVLDSILHKLVVITRKRLEVDIKAQIETTTSDYDREKLQERLAKLAGGVAVLYIGAASEVEMKEKKDRVDDALSATRAAIAEGIVPGGGVAYIRCIPALDGLKGANEDETTGIEIVKRAIEEPLRQITANAGVEGAVVVQKVKDGEGDFGYNARTDTYENFFAAGVIDPAKVTRVALENAASIAGMFLTTECVIADKKEENPAPAMPAPGMGCMGGMM